VPNRIAPTGMPGMKAVDSPSGGQRNIPFKLAAIDLDDTLLGRNKTVSEANLAAVKRLQLSGVKVIIASGRSHESCVAFHKLLELDGPVVSCQGGLVQDPESGRVLHKGTISAELAARILEGGAAFGATSVCYSENGVFSIDDNHWTSFYNRVAGHKLQHIAEWDYEKTGLPFKIQWLDTSEKVEHMMANLCPTLAADANVLTYGRFVVEFISPGVSKGHALSLVALEHKVDRSEVLCFGDEINDISMLSWAGLGVAMGHANDSVKAAAALAAPAGDPATALARAIDMVFDRY
jgi:Cof subfamily protein (haloacid dehalogenase superfamily)